jgi:hypothetical protein
VLRARCSLYSSTRLSVGQTSCVSVIRWLTTAGLNSRQYKNANRNPISLEIPILAELQRIINATTPLGKDTYLVTEFSGVGMLVLLPSPSCQRPLRLLRGA